LKGNLENWRIMIIDVRLYTIVFEVVRSRIFEGVRIVRDAVLDVEMLDASSINNRRDFR
jgi:hypothetical protein